MSMIMQFRWISETHPLAGRPSPRIIGLYVQRGMNSLACDFSIRLIRLNLAEWHVPHAEGTRAGVGASVFLMLCLTRRWRLRLLDALFDQALSEIDPSFLARRKYSWVHPDDETMRIVGTVVFCLIQTNRTNVFMRNTQLFITCAKH